ncbi:MAG TPA: penicillin-binding protein 2 [Rhizomicrobium sp.]|nr:penicillin-binding protein 2 [Rhizomicrobium sp.]
MPLFDRKDKSRYATFTRRTVMMGGGVSAVLAVLGGRLYQLQIVNGELYMTRAEENRVNQRLLAPLRGRILDRFGTELAGNRRNYRVLLIPEQTSGGVEKALDTVGRIILLTPHDRERILHDIASNKKFVPATVAENLTWEEFSRVNLHLPYLSGIVPDVGETRDYPYGDVLSHVLGYVAAVSEKDMQADPNPVLSLPGFRIGKRGIEKAYDSAVRGKAGIDRVEVNAYGRVIRELSRDPGTPGSDIYLTIDNDLQRYAAARIGQESAAACVVMDVTNGDVLALVSTPGFDPNLFNVGIKDAQWKALTTDDHTPLVNKAISGTYPPGSTFKTTMALGAVDNGMADLVVDCTGSMRLGDHIFYCDAWRIGGHGHVDLQRGIQVSCDLFFYQVAMRLGIDKMEEVARTIGWGAPTGIELPGELAGFVPSRAWKRARFHEPWEEGETLVNGIGQGYMLATPIQLCMFAARIATGNAVWPSVTRVVGKAVQPRAVPKHLSFSDKAFAMVREGMRMAVNEPGGTAYGSRITEPGFEMAGKTGTAQVRRITRQERANGLTPQSKLPWKDREHALFIGFAPIENPRYALSVVVEHGGARSEPQVQLARDILFYAQKRQTAMLPTAYPTNAAELYVPPAGVAKS